MKKRNKHNLSHYHNTTFNLGNLIPTSCVEVLPGDTFEMETSALLRMSTLVRPVMHPVEVRVHQFFVPMRLLWTGWEDFITGASATPPPTTSGAAHDHSKLYSYLGLNNDPSTGFCLMPIRAYNMIWNEYFRDQDLHTERSIDDLTVAPICWEKDYFSAARPWAQQGTEVSLPLGSTAPVQYKAGVGSPGKLRKALDDTSTGGAAEDLQHNSAGNMINKTSLQSIYYDPQGTLEADLSNATAANISELREAVAMQNYKEARARYGDNYVDYLRYLGVNPSDARLRRPELLSSGKQTIAFSEVLNTGDSTGNIGDMHGHGISAIRTNKFRSFFEEHGYIMTMVSMRPRSIYCSGIHRKFTKLAKEDYYHEEFEHIGQQEIKNRELYAAHSNPTGIFGYTDRYREYKEETSYVSGEMRQAIADDWHLGRIFTSDTALNSTFVECNPDPRIFADAGTNHNVYGMFSHKIVARRRVSRQPGKKLGL